MSDEIGVSEAYQATAEVGDTTLNFVSVRLDNCIVMFTFQYPTNAGESVNPDTTGTAKDGIDRLLG